RIKSLLLVEGLEFPPAPAGSQWSFLVKKKLRELPCSTTVRFKLDRLLDSLEFDEKQVLKATREIRRFCQTDPELSQCIEYLKTRRAERILSHRGQKTSPSSRFSGRYCSGGSQTQCAGVSGVDETETLRGQTKSSIGSFDPRGDCAPGNDSTAGSTRRNKLL